MDEMHRVRNYFPNGIPRKTLNSHESVLENTYGGNELFASSLKVENRHVFLVPRNIFHCTNIRKKNYELYLL